MPEVKEHEPRLALDGEADGLSFYREIINEAPDYLNQMDEFILNRGRTGRRLNPSYERERIFRSKSA